MAKNQNISLKDKFNFRFLEEKRNLKKNKNKKQTNNLNSNIEEIDTRLVIEPGWNNNNVDTFTNFLSNMLKSGKKVVETLEKDRAEDLSKITQKVKEQLK